MHKFSVTLAQERQTKGAILYHELDGGGNKLDMRSSMIGNLYIRKNAFPDGVAPMRINVSIESLD